MGRAANQKSGFCSRSNKARERGNDILGAPTIPTSQRTFPDRRHPPVPREEFGLDPRVSGAVAIDLCLPEVGVGSGPHAQGAVMPMPETPMDEHDCPR